MKQQTIQGARQRAYSYQFEDGFIEMAQGSVFFLLGALLWWIDELRSVAETPWPFVGGVFIFTLLSAVVVGFTIKRMKNRVTFPRTGQVEYRPEPKEEGRNSIIIIAIALLLASAAIWMDDWFVDTVSIVGAGISITMLGTAMRTRLLRMRVIAILPLLLGILMAYLRADEIQGSALLFGAVGLTQALTGVFALRSYLAKNPEPSDKEA